MNDPRYLTQSAFIGLAALLEKHQKAAQKLVDKAKL